MFSCSTYQKPDLRDVILLVDRNIDVHIRAIRKKLGESRQNLIETIRGVGYRFKES